MNYLIDTHVFLWSLLAPEKLSKKAIKVLEDSKNMIWISAVSYWEISLKHTLSKLELEGVLVEELPGKAKDLGFRNLDLDCDTAIGAGKLPKLKHKDPFDRLIIWQAIRNKYRLISKDKGFGVYEKFGLELYW